jgi:membrane-bound lytic murein transglycosylase
MARPKRTKLTLDEDSLNKLLQEIYNDSHNIKAKIARLFSKWETKVKDEDDIQALGESIIKLINAESKNQDQKIMLLRYLKEIVYAKDAKSSNTDDSQNHGTITPEGRNELIKMAKEAMKNDEKNK